MQKEQQQNEKQQIQKPSFEQVEQWVRRDLEASHYFIGLLLRYPEAIKKAAEEIYRDVELKENGPAISTVEKQ